VTPANIMLNHDGSVKLMDFGLALPMTDIDFAIVDSVAGTPGYMAPEQTLGGCVTTATDSFALASIGYEMLSGRPLVHERAYA
jgi:serine/threonine protein kinase